MGIKIGIINGVKTSEGRMHAVPIDVKANCSKQGEMISFQIVGDDQSIRVPVKAIEELIAGARKGKK